MEIKFQAPDAIDAMLSPQLRLLDSVEVPRHRRDDDLITANYRWRFTKVSAIFLHTGKARDRELRAARHVPIKTDFRAAEVLPVFRHRYQLSQWGVELDDVRKEFGRVLRVRLVHTLDGARQPAEPST